MRPRLIGRSMRSRPVLFGLAVWLVAEFVVFALVVDRIGILGAMLIGLATLLIGFAALRRVGMGALRGLRAAAADGQPRRAGEGQILDGTLAALGALLLILPGFLSDLAGLALTAPSLRGWIIRRYGPPPKVRRKSRRPEVIDLEPGDWQKAGDRRPARDS